MINKIDRPKLQMLILLIERH